MKVGTVSLATIRKNKAEAVKTAAKMEAKQRFESKIKEIAREMYPQDLFMRDRNVSDSLNSSVTDQILLYMGKLETCDDIIAPWGKNLKF